jgi:DNA-binding NtrC family response regulator
MRRGHMGGNILIVDQNSTYREILEGLLEKRGYKVTSIQEGYQLSGFLKEAAFDIIFLDNQTGGIRDKGLFLKIKKQQPQCHIILITSKKGDGFIREAMEAGAYGCINKPFNPDEILTMVRHIIRA